jgi:hypothetical protein
MNWNTIYITGNADFWEDVNKKLSHSDLNFLSGYMEQRPDGTYRGLYWIDNQVDMRQFKEAVSGKLVWKYRLRFFTELEQQQLDETFLGDIESFSDKEKALIKSMRQKSAA